MEALSEALQAVSDAVASGDVVVAAVAGAMVLGLAILKFLGKSIPVLDPILNVVLNVVKGMRKPKAPAELPKSDGLADIVQIKPEDKE